MRDTSKASFSTGMIIAVLLLSVGTLITLFPYHLLGSGIQYPAPDASGTAIWQWRFSKAAEAVGLTSPLWVGLLMWLDGRRARRAASRLLATASSQWTKAQVLADVAHPQVLESMSVFARTEFYVSGDPGLVMDEGGRLESSPRALQWREGKVLRSAVLIPAAYLRRFAAHPQAWQAVLTHELAHFANHDIRLLYVGARLLRAVAWTGWTGVGLSMVASLLADAPPLSLAAVQASLAGKAYLFSALLLLLGAGYALGRLQAWREALADSTAANVSGEEALVEARLLASGEAGKIHPSAVEPTAEERALAYVLTPFDLTVFSFLVTVIANTVASPLAYLANFGSLSEDGRTMLQACGAIVLNLVGFVSFFYALKVQAGAPRSLSSRTVMTLLALMVGGSVAAQWLTQAAPLIVSSVGMPDGFDYVFRHDPWPLTLSMVLAGGITAAFWVLFSVAGLWLQSRSHRTRAALLPGMVWYAGGPLEAMAFPRLALGWLTVGLSLAAFVLAWRAGRGPALAPQVRSLLKGCLPLSPLLALGWIGWGDVGHLAASASQAGTACLKSDQVEEALPLLRLAAHLSPGDTAGASQLAAVLAQQPGHQDEAVAWSERALQNPLLHSWNERFAILALAGDIRLQRRGAGDIPAALRHYEAAVALHRANSRLESSQVAGMLYNYACAVCVQGGATERAAMSPLLEAVLMDYKYAEAALADPDLQTLRLTRRPDPAANAVQLLKSLSAEELFGVPAPLRLGLITDDQYGDFVALVIRSKAEAN